MIGEFPWWLPSSEGNTLGLWQQLKQSRVCQGKSKIKSWEKLLKHMRAALLSDNYTRTMY
jgi:hypothetical protein